VAASTAVVIGGTVGVDRLVWNAAAPHPVPATSTPTHTASSTLTLPGWQTDARWSVPAASAVTRADGQRVAVLTGTRVTVYSAAGKRVGEAAASASTTLLSGTIDGEPALIAVDASKARVLAWVGAKASAVAAQLPGDSHCTVAARGPVFAVCGSSVSVLGTDGIRPYGMPAPGLQFVGLTSAGALQWADATGDLVTAPSSGVATARVQLRAPAPGAHLQSALNGGGVITSLWVVGATRILATHNASSGALIGQTKTTASMMVRSQSGTSAMVGAALVNLATGAISLPAPAFVAASGLGGGFYGASAGRNAILRASSKAPVPAGIPTVLPVGTTNDGQLLALAAGQLSAFPSAPVPESTPSGTAK